MLTVAGILAWGIVAVLADGTVDPYERALIAAVHQFAREGELAHLEAILDKHPEFLTAREPKSHTVPMRTDNYTPLDWAVDRGFPSVVQALIRRGAKVNSVVGQGCLQLHNAAERGHVDVVRVLIANGAKVNADDGRGRTPLHEAARRGHLAVVRELVEQGADVTARSDATPEIVQHVMNPAPNEPDHPPIVYPAVPRRTALEWAEAEGKSDVADYLRRLGKQSKPRA